MRIAGTRGLLGWLAVMGPIVFTLAWIVAAAAQDDYSPWRGYISELAALDAEHAWIMITGSLLLGAGIVALAVGLARAVKGRAATVGSILLVIAGVGVIVSGLARPDCYSQLEACAARIDAGDVSWHHAIHDWADLAILALVAAPLVLARAFRGDQSWRNLGAYSIVTGVVGLVLVVLLYSGVAESWAGVLQRMFVTVLLLWVAILGARLIRLPRARTVEPAI